MNNSWKIKMTPAEWNMGIDYLRESEDGYYVSHNNRDVIVRNMTAGRFSCYEDNSFVKIVATEFEAMLFLDGVN